MRLNKWLKFITIVFFTNLFLFSYPFVKSSFAQTKSFFEGPYVGGAIGNTKFKTRFSNPEYNDSWYTPDGRADLNKSNITGSVSAGYNWISNQSYLLGLEAEVSNGYSKTWRGTDNYYGDPPTKVKSNIDYIVNLRLKAGIIHEGKNLFYVTAGPAMAKAKYSAGYDDGTFPISINKTVYGLSYGIGVERQIDDKGSIKLEYMLTDLDSKSKPYPNYDGTGCYEDPPGTKYYDCRGPSWKTKTSSIRIGYNYHF
jgi:opacity protein-like surface antigen